MFFNWRGQVIESKNRGRKKICRAVYNSDYMPLLKIGGWVSTKIRKSKSSKTSYHLHHATISQTHQPLSHSLPFPNLPLTPHYLYLQPQNYTPYTSHTQFHCTTPNLYYSLTNLPHPTISPTPFLTNHPSQITLHFHPTNHQYSPHPHLNTTPNPPQISPTHHPKNIIPTP